MIQHELDVPTRGSGFTRLDPIINRWLATTGISNGALHLTCLHTSASLTINENADPRVLDDLASWMDRVVPRNHPYRHDDEGPDDMPAHIRTALTAQTMTLSLAKGRLWLGTWQAVYLWEHRDAAHQRRIACQLIGEQDSAAQRATKLNQDILQRHDPDAWARDGGLDTDVDLMVDRLHDITSDSLPADP
ncbi:secondary thiamine-phosphate synthase enzyme YjbQ [Synechococcus sp. CC9616]|jgi:secondary thiamine-phosphate synthase enzyme|uniref:secondary thiamine-phosphate synthase enzyme YjbQ n=1 Tax=Synechococcus sp. CC9616 TaxID=110663 RepID=UPI0004B2FBBB|nr:secondary thiamine-phosphate synthase enzyme YjbQ [Synechococcus sp. CC9616]RPF83070.1 MAG: YjbQ family protein [Synechococcus sp. TMED20]|tara:strand:+ start:958 stop:1527 length:570 start_codon:yes stop_codon:yes gene_type:complete